MITSLQCRVLKRLLVTLLQYIVDDETDGNNGYYKVIWQGDVFKNQNAANRAKELDANDNF